MPFCYVFSLIIILQRLFAMINRANLFLNIIHSFMQSNLTFAVFALLLVCLVAQNVVLVNSGVSTTTVVSPPGQTTVFQEQFNSGMPNFLGTGATWVWVGGPTLWPDGYTATFQALFYSDCPQSLAILQITADNIFTAYLNDLKVGYGSDWKQAFSFKVGVKCGLNNLTVVVTNKDDNSPASLIFSITQEQKGCYDCSKNPLASYNSKTCQCECSSRCSCSALQQWLDYPSCGCKCNKETLLSCKPDTSLWSQSECRCVCKKKWCPLRQVQDSKSCECTCPSISVCPPGVSWNPVTCSCEYRK